VPSKTMMTMDTSTTEYISHQRSPNQTTIEKPSLTLKEDNTADSGICGLPNKSYKPTPILRTIPTRINPTDAANTANAVNAVVVDPDVDDEDPDPMELQTDATALTFLTEWDAFYNDFVQSSTYTLAHSNANSNLQSLADAYDRSTKRPQITPGYSQSLHQLHQVLEELEKVNDQLFQLFAAPTPPAPCPPSPQNHDNNLLHRLSPAPTLDRTPQSAVPCVIPSAPNPATIPL